MKDVGVSHSLKTISMLSCPAVICFQPTTNPGLLWQEETTNPKPPKPQLCPIVITFIPSMWESVIHHKQLPFSSPVITAFFWSTYPSLLLWVKTYNYAN